MADYITFQPSDYFNTTLWTGDGNSTQDITGTGFNADWIWLKGRSGAGDHQVYDKVRGVQKMLISNGNNAESTNSIGLQTFGSDGFTMGSDMTGSGSTFTSWNWLANGQGSANSDGTITTTYTSANTTSGFSISTYTGDGTSGATIGHGLGVTPKWILVKRLNAADAWLVYHPSLGATKYLILDTTAAQATSTSIWNDTAPTSSVFSVGNNTAVNASGSTYVAYCFAEKKGFSRIGKYKGNGSADGTFVYTGFKPAFVLYRNYEITESWMINDSQRLGYNPNNAFLFPNATQAESNVTRIDILSNGFKFKTTDNGQNGNGYDYIYMAFAEKPIVSSNDVPGVAR